MLFRSAAAERFQSALPVPAVICGRDVGAALAVPRSRIEAAFTWSPSNPVADAVTAAGGSDLALHDVAALHYALHPDSGYFATTGGRLVVVPEKKTECAAELVALATSKPAPPPARGK